MLEIAGVVFDGDIRVNGRQIDRSFCDISGYIYQDDLFVGSMTTREHLTFNVITFTFHTTTVLILNYFSTI